MSQRELLRYAVGTLEAGAIPYMVTGSTVSSLQGQPRSTHDIDIVVDPRPTAIGALLAAFAPPRFYLEEAAIRAAVAQRSMFNVIDLEEGDKIDFWLLSDDGFEQSSFRRRRQETGAGITMFVSQPEDTILGKLKRAKASRGSEKQMSDCIAVYEVNHGALDLKHLRRWAHELDVEELWERVQREADVG